MQSQSVTCTFRTWSAGIWLGSAVVLTPACSSCSSRTADSAPALFGFYSRGRDHIAVQEQPERPLQVFADFTGYSGPIAFSGNCFISFELDCHFVIVLHPVHT